MMENLTHKTTLLALSQGFAKTLESQCNLSPVKKVMPFLALAKAARKQGAADYLLSGQRNDLEWQEARINSFSKISHHHTNINRNSVHYQSTGQAGVSSAVERQESSPVLQSLVYRPLLLQVRNEKKTAVFETNNNNSSRIALQISGMLSTARPRRQTPVQMKLPDSAEFTNDAVNAMSWSIPMPRNEERFQISGSRPVTGFPIVESVSRAGSDRYGQKKGSENAYLSSPDMPGEKPRQESAERNTQIVQKNFGPRFSTDLAERVAASYIGSGLPGDVPEQRMQSPNYNSGVPISLPNRKHQYPLPTARIDSSAAFSNEFTEKVEHLITEKVQKLVPVRNSDKAVIDEVKREIQEKLKPESIVNEQMIRIVMAKLQRSMREQRFRLGLMS